MDQERSKAEEDLRVIRSLMERAALYRAEPAYSGRGHTMVPGLRLQRRGRAGASRSVDRFLWIGIAFYRSFRAALARLPGLGILPNSSCITGVEKRGRRFAGESAEHRHGHHIRSVSSDLRSLCLAAETGGRNRTICLRLNEVRLPET